MQEYGMQVKIKTTLYLLLCSYIKSKWVLNKLSKLPICKIYCNGKLTETLTLGDILK